MRSRLNFDAIQREINTRLDPNSIAIDGRDLRDRLAFVASVAELIIFYDENNKESGNWHSLVLKDPVILLAVMSKTDYQAAHSQYAQIQPSLSESKTWFTQEESADEPQTPSSIALTEQQKIAIHQLLRLLDNLFQRINQWAFFLTDSNTNFPLREYLMQQVPQRLSLLLWQRLSLQKYLAKKFPSCVPSIPNFSISDFCSLWQVQPTDPDSAPVSVAQALQQLETIYHAVFTFFVQVVTEAKSAFYDLVTQQNDFPDTSLIIACNHLLQYSQEGLNEFSRKHLDFYYHKLLHQQLKSASPDTTYVCLTLAEKQQSLNLDAGTAFKGGIYADKSPIIFSSDDETEINQISVQQLFSSSYGQVTPELSSEENTGASTEENASANTEANATLAVPFAKQQRVQLLPDSTQVRRNQKGQILASEWFGSSQTTDVQQGFVLASPMFYLQSGERHLVLTFTLSEAISLAAIVAAEIAVSSTKGWQTLSEATLGESCASSSTGSESTNGAASASTDPAVGDIESAASAQEPKTASPKGNATLANSLAVATSTTTWRLGDTPQQIVLSITLNESFPALTYFKKAPLGFNNTQCYCRVLLPNSINLQQNIMIDQLHIAVQASNSGNFALSNDTALLVNNKPMAIFGSMADVGNHCFVSSPEAFSKPLKSIDLTLTWDNLDADISSYFSAYNTYLKTLGSDTDRYTNTAFTVDWAAETDSGWSTMTAELTSTTPAPETTSDMSDTGNTQTPSATATPKKKPWYKRLWNWAEQEAHEVVDHLEHHNQETALAQQADGLFAQTADNENAPQSSYHLQFDTGFRFESQAVSELASNKNPRLRFTLTGPVDTFGNSLYGPLVSAITLQNAQTLMDGFGLFGWLTKLVKAIARLVTSSTTGKTKPLPNTPLILKAKKAQLQYEAEQLIDFTLATPTLSQDFTLLHIGIPNTYVYFQQAANSDAPSIDYRGVTLQPQAIPTPSAAEQPASPSTSSAKQDVTSTSLKNQPVLELAAGCSLFQGVSNPALSVMAVLQHIQPPCRLSIFIELAQDISSDQQANEVMLFYWSTTGWKPMSILNDGTKALTRSGLLSVDIPSDIGLDCELFTDPTAKPTANPLNQGQLLLTQSGDRRVATVYCNTQGVKVSRAAPIAIAAGDMPHLAALSIKQTQQKQPAISKIVQPFASVGGAPAENTSLFTARVSQRLKTKDRASNTQDFVTLVKQADADVYFVKHLHSKRAGQVKLGLVQQYASSDTSNAFRPVVPRASQAIIQDFLAKRVSAMTQVSLSNLLHEPLKVVATLVINETANANDLTLSLVEGIDCYLSPWITAEQAQYCLADGLSKAGLTQFIASFEEVEAVQSLQLMPTTTDNSAVSSAFTSTLQTVAVNPESQDDDVCHPASENSIWVAADDHEISFIRAGSVSNGGQQDSSPTPLSLPENKLSEANA